MIRNTAKNRFNIDKIKETINNDIWINYKGLCDRLDIEYKSGNAKRAQLKELLLLCEYEKQGTKFKLLKLRSKEETRKWCQYPITHIQNAHLYFIYLCIITYCIPIASIV